MVGAVGRQHEGRLGVVELARDREHLGVGHALGVEDHPAGLPVNGVRVKESTW